MKKKLPITKNKDVVVSWVYTWSKQQDMSIHEQRIVLRILEACQAELKGVKLKDYAGTKRKFEHGLWDVDAQMHVSDVIFSGRDYNEIIAALDSLAGRFFTYEDDEEWWKCGFISNPKYKKHTGIITFRVSNDLWDVFTKFAKGYREFELNKALALPTGYSLRFYMLMSGQVYPLDISLDNLKDRLGIPADKYKDKNGKDRIDNFEERVLKPAKAALDESCPYTFNYVKVRENPNNKRSKVTGFRFYPVYQPQFRDEELEGKELQAKVTARYQIDSHVYEYLRYSCGFTSEEINRNKETFITAQEKITDLIGELADNLKEERSQSLSASADIYHRFGAFQVNFLVEGFYTKLSDVFALTDGEVVDGILTRTRYNAPGARVMGLTLEGKMAYLTKFQVQAGVTLQQSHYSEPHVWNKEAPAVKKMMRTPNTYGYFTATYTPIKPLSIALSGTYTGSMLVPHEPVPGFLEKPITVNTKDFFDIGLKAAYDFKLYKSMNLQVNAGVQNIFNAYQNDFDKGADRDSGYIYGPSLPRSFFAGVKISY